MSPAPSHHPVSHKFGLFGRGLVAGIAALAGSGPALRLRLVEARRRGFFWLAGAGALGVFSIALWGGATPDGRYGLASDIAVTAGYVLAVFLGAFPVAIDRERRRSYLPAASPITPWGWALGNALGAATVAGAVMALLFTCAGAGAAAGGGIETWDVGRVPSGPHWLPQQMELGANETRIRARVRAYAKASATVGTAFQASVEVDGQSYDVAPNETVVFTVKPGQKVWFRPGDGDYLIGLDEIRTLREKQSFLGNALLASIGPALGAAGLAAIASAAGASLAAPVAALLAILLLLLSGMKGFLLDTLEFEGALQESRTASHTHTHDHGGADPARAPSSGTRAIAKRVLRGALAVVPDLDAYDRSDRVALGEWLWKKKDRTDWGGAGAALLTLAIGLLVATIVGGLGLIARRMP